MHRKRRLGIAFALSLCFMVLIAFALATASGAAAPRGNSGTVKVDGVEFADLHKNEPHPSCDFRITFWGFGEDRGPATANFVLHPPTEATTGPDSVSYGPIEIGDDPAGGGNDYDGQVLVNLEEFLADSGATAHPQQGFHVKLTVEAPGAQGADVKHKVFWVECSTEVLGGGETRKPPKGDDDTEVLGGRLARTAAPLLVPAFVAAEMILLGMGMAIASRRPRRAGSTAKIRKN